MTTTININISTLNLGAALTASADKSRTKSFSMEADDALSSALDTIFEGFTASEAVVSTTGDMAVETVTPAAGVQDIVNALGELLEGNDNYGMRSAKAIAKKLGTGFCGVEAAIASAVSSGNVVLKKKRDGSYLYTL